MLSDDIIMPILLPFASSGVFSRKNNGKSADDLDRGVEVIASL